MLPTRTTLLAMSLAACGSPLRLELPAGPGDRSVLLIVERGTGLSSLSLAQISALDLDPEGGAVPVDALPAVRLDAAETLRITALRLPAPLADLGLEPGGVEPLAAAEMGRPLPQANTISVLELPPDFDRGEWRDQSTLPRSLVGLTVRRGDSRLCQRFIVTETQFDTAEEVVFIAGLATFALVGDNAGRLYVVQPDGSWQLIESIAPRSILTTQLASDGRHWVGGVGGQIRRVLLGQTGVRAGLTVTFAPSQGPVFSLDGVYRGVEVEELFTVTQEGVFERFFEGAWTELGRQRTTTIGGVVRTGPGEALAALNQPEILRVANGTVTAERVSRTGADASAIALVPALGVVVGTGRGEILARGAAGWELLGQSAAGIRLKLLLPYREGFLATGELGQIEQFVPGSGFCAPIARRASTLQFGAVVGEVVILGGDPAHGAAFNTVTTLRPE
ncbi:MAG: hypothetical protein IT384_17075 [Deltaproteobacteria bacterium]|nr:hypothetical protein [Deltaproteobacteria bacterium]